MGLVGVVLLTALAAWLRWPGLDPGTLWLDDAWVALVGRADTWADFGRIVVTAPLHTSLVWLALLPVDGVSELAAQLPAWTAAVATPAVTYALLRRLGTSTPAALAAATVVTVAPVHVLYATRVKPYTLDALLAVVLLYLAVRVLREPSRSRWVRLVAVALGATLASSLLAIVSAGAVGVPALAGLVAGGERRSRAAVGVAAYLGGAGSWWLMVLRRTVRPGLTAYWADHFVPLDDPAVARTVVAEGTSSILASIAPLPVVVTGVGVLAVVVLLALRSRWLPLLLVVPVLTALTLAVLDQAPWGGGRTDTYLVGVLAIGVGLALDGLALDGVASRRAVAVSAAGIVGVALVAAGLAWGRPGYPEHDVRAFVEQVDAVAAPGEPVVVYPATRWAYALYTDRPVSLVDDPSTANGFEPRVDDDQVVVLPPLRDTPERYLEHLEAATAGADRVWLVASHWASDLGVLQEQMDGLGFAVETRDERRGALLTQYVRR